MLGWIFSNTCTCSDNLNIPRNYWIVILFILFSCLCDVSGYGDTSREVEREYQNALKGGMGMATTEDLQKLTLKEESSSMQGQLIKAMIYIPVNVYAHSAANPVTTMTCIHVSLLLQGSHRYSTLRRRMSGHRAAIRPRAHLTTHCSDWTP